jgi:hypothetical protein
MVGKSCAQGVVVMIYIESTYRISIRVPCVSAKDEKLNLHHCTAQLRSETSMVLPAAMLPSVGGYSLAVYGLIRPHGGLWLFCSERAPHASPHIRP